jgi:hypothetical protein
MKKTLVVAILIVAMILGIVAYAFAANPEYVTVNARVNPVFTLTVTPVGLDSVFSDVDPDSTYTRDVTVRVSSNRSGTLSTSWDKTPAVLAQWGMSNAYASAGFGKGKGQNFDDVISFSPTYATPSLGSATPFVLTYSAVQGTGD